MSDYKDENNRTFEFDGTVFVPGDTDDIPDEMRKDTQKRMDLVRESIRRRAIKDGTKQALSATQPDYRGQGYELQQRNDSKNE